MKKVIVFLVAGMSSRFNSHVPKQFAKVGLNHEPLIEVSVNQALTQDFDEIIFITNPLTKDLYVNHFGKSFHGKNIEYINQIYDKEKRTRPWGTTDAICSLLNSKNIEKNAIYTIVNGDDLYSESAFQILFENLEKNPKNYIGGLLVRDTIISDTAVNRGIIQIKNNKVSHIYEQTNITRNDTEFMNQIANVNFLCFTLDTIEKLNKKLNIFKNEFSNDSKKECFITSTLNELIEEKTLILDYLPLKENIQGVTFQEDVLVLREKLLDKMN